MAVRIGKTALTCITPDADCPVRLCRWFFAWQNSMSNQITVNHQDIFHLILINSLGKKLSLVKIFCFDRVERLVSGHRDWESHHTGRKLAPHVIAADGIKGQDPDFDRDFRSFLETLSAFQHPQGGSPRTLMQCAEDRPNNIGTMCRLALVSIHAYLQDETVDTDRLINIQKGFLGDRSAYDNFDFGNLDWQCNPNQPVAINSPGCTIRVGGETLEVGGGTSRRITLGEFRISFATRRLSLDQSSGFGSFDSAS